MFWFLTSSNEFFSSLKIVLLVSRLFGNFPINEKLALSCSGIVHTFSLMGFSLFCMYIDKDESLKRRKWHDIAFISYLSVSTTICDSIEYLASFSVCLNAGKMRKVFLEFLSILDKLKTLEERFDLNGISYLKHTLIWLSYFIVLFISEMVIRHSTDNDYFKDPQDYSIIGKFITLMTPCSVVSLYVALFTIIRLIFKHIRKAAINTFENKPVKDNYLKLKTIVSVFNLTCELCNGMSQLFGFMVLVMALSTFCSNVVMTYYMITKLNDHEKYTPFHWFLSWIILFNGKIWFIIESVTLANKEVRHTF